MSKTRVIKQGEHLSGIAQEEGFVNFHTIFDHPNNAALKALRDPHDLFPGALNPATKLSGQQARLNNLGYFAGFALRDLEQLLWAAEEFACDHIGKPVKTRPAIKPAPPGGEDDPDVADPNDKTGIQDAKIIAKLVAVHGI